MRIVSLSGCDAMVETEGLRRKANLSFLERPKVGDYVMVHAGFAIEKVDAKAAKETLKAFRYE
jgi:hydrogenase expression/formation protein HypC